MAMLEAVEGCARLDSREMYVNAALAHDAVLLHFVKIG
jgi:hypothetical protein